MNHNQANAPSKRREQSKFFTNQQNTKNRQSENNLIEKTKITLDPILHMKAIGKIMQFKIKVFARVPQQCNLAAEINKNFKSNPERAKLCASCG